MSLKEDKMEVDLSPLVDVKIPELRKIAIEVRVVVMRMRTRDVT
jgi:hypothetical protein